MLYSTPDPTGTVDGTPPERLGPRRSSPRRAQPQARRRATPHPQPWNVRVALTPATTRCM